jgi:2-polyprenyl-3-methyl-5-hydroxy-6-metoxy-1,4-benzoquinol methylase
MSTVDYTDTYDPDTDFDRYYTLAAGARIRERLEPGARVLELGCATGLMTSVFADGSVEVLGVDRSCAYLDRARARGLANVRFVSGDLEALAPTNQRFDHIIATSVLHELLDPLAFLGACRERLAAAGLDPHSIHRLCAVELGMIDSLTEISARGEQWGTRALWTADDLQALAAEAGLRTVAREGIMLKPLPNAQMAALGEEVIEGFIRVARHLPDHCAMNYLVLADG